MKFEGQPTTVDQQKIIRKNLLKIPTGELQKILGKEITEALHKGGVSINAVEMAEQIIEVKAEQIFENEIVRSYFSEFFNIKAPNSWKDNKQCKFFLEKIGLSYDYLPEKKQVRKLLETVKTDFNLHDFQDFIKRKTSNFLLNNNNTKLMIQLPTGAGKTALAMHSIYDFLRVSEEENPLIVWMAHTDELCEQAIESFQIGWKGAGTKEVNLLRLWGGTIKNIKRDLADMPKGPIFAVASFQTANSMIKTNKESVFELFIKIRKKNCLLVVDEAHMALAETYNEAIELFKGRNSKIIGLTATPGRHGIDEDTDGTKKLADYFEMNILNLNEFCQGKTPIKYLQDRKILSKVERLVLQTNHEINFTAKELKQLESTHILSDKKLKESGDDPERTRLVIDQIWKLVEQEKKILVFAPSKNSSETYAALLKTKGVEAASVTGETSFSNRTRAVKDFSTGDIDVLINFGVFTTGFDDPKIDCVLIARPTFSVVLYSQMVGRGLRGPENNGTESCLLVDVIDNISNQPDIEVACDYFKNEWE